MTPPLMRLAPFPHQIIEDAWKPEEIAACAEEIDHVHPDSWVHCWFKRGEKVVEAKRSISFDRCQNMPATGVLFRQLSSPDFIRQLEVLTKIDRLRFDFLGGGVHLIQPGDFLYPHVDFNVANGRWRRVNVLVYLTECNGGELRLYDQEGQESVVIAPKPGRTVVFICSEQSWHGHPIPLGAGPNRKSLAAYYFTEEPPADAAPEHITLFGDVRFTTRGI